MLEKSYKFTFQSVFAVFLELLFIELWSLLKILSRRCYLESLDKLNLAKITVSLRYVQYGVCSVRVQIYGFTVLVIINLYKCTMYPSIFHNERLKFSSDS